MTPAGIHPVQTSLHPADDTAGELFAAIEGSVQPVCIYRSRRYLYANQAYADLLGFGAPDELLQLPDIIRLIHPDDRAMASKEARARIAGQKASERHEFRMLRKDGSTLWVETVGSYIEWNGQPAALVFAADITGRKLTEEALRQSERLFATVFHSSPDIMIVSTAVEGRIVDVNDALLKVRDLKREDVIGRTGEEVGLWEDPAQRNQVIEAVRRRGAVRDLMTTHHAVNPADGLRHYTASAELVRVNGEELLVWSARDITALRQAEAALVYSKEAAEEASRAKSEFLANMSHELRTPLNAILGFSEVIRDQLYGPAALSRYSEYAEDIHKSGAYLLHIINDLLALAKVEAGKFELHDADISIAALAGECLRMVEGQAKESNLRLVADIEEPSPIICADDRSMKQILINLLSNAIKFTPPEGTISLTAHVDRGLILMVSDTGIGMSKKDIAIALTPFGQIENAMTRRHQGTGLGLPLARSLVELHGGQLEIRSRPGRGTTVAVVLPPERIGGRPRAA